MPMLLPLSILKFIDAVANVSGTTKLIFSLSFNQSDQNLWQIFQNFEDHQYQLYYDSSLMIS